MLQDAPQLLHKYPGLFGGSYVRLGYDLHQRNARPVEILEAVLGAVDAAALAGMNRLAGILLHVHARYPHPKWFAADVDIQMASNSQGKVVLRYLVIFWHVGIKIVLAVEDGVGSYL